MANLMSYETGSFIRTATADEAAASLAAAERDGGVGAIVVAGQTCYVGGLEVEAAGFVGDQKWTLVGDNGVCWAIPTGWPNNASPICEESEPAAYREIADALSR